jgi:hypothetical protein
MHRPRISNITLLPNRFWATIRGRIQYAHSEPFSEVRLRPFTTYILLYFFNSVDQIHKILFQKVKIEEQTIWFTSQNENHLMQIQ